MNKGNFSETITKLATVPQAKERYKLGRTKLMEIADEAGAIRHFGKAVRIDVTVLDNAIASY